MGRDAGPEVLAVLGAARGPAEESAVIPLSYGTGGGGDIHATAMARHTTIYRGAPGGCGCNP